MSGCVRRYCGTCACSQPRAADRDRLPNVRRDDRGRRRFEFRRRRGSRVGVSTDRPATGGGHDRRSPASRDDHRNDLRSNVRSSGLRLSDPRRLFRRRPIAVRTGRGPRWGGLRPAGADGHLRSPLATRGAPDWRFPAGPVAHPCVVHRGGARAHLARSRAVWRRQFRVARVSRVARACHERHRGDVCRGGSSTAGPVVWRASRYLADEIRLCGSQRDPSGARRSPEQPIGGPEPHSPQRFMAAASTPD